MSNVGIDLEQARELYLEQKLTLAATSKHMDVPYRRLRKALLDSGIKIRGDTGSARGFQVSKERLEELYLNQQLSTPDIAKVLGVHQATVLRKLHDAGVPTRSISEGERNATAQGKNWGGTRKRMEQVKSSDGYFMRKELSHPRVDSNGYIKVHILVWEEGHGKFVPVGSVVHHINGVLTDNRLENLHMFTNSEHSKFHMFARRCAVNDGHSVNPLKACPTHLLERYFREWQRRGQELTLFQFPE